MKYFTIILLWLSAHWVVAQLSLSGIIKDESSKNPVEAKIMAMVNNRKQPVGKTQGNGSFKINLEPEMTAILIESANYRPLFLPIFIEGQAGSGDFMVDLTLLPIGKQTNNKPFDQSEQSQFQLDAKDNKNAAKSVRTFRIIDGFSNKMVNAELCLYYTQTGQKKCFSLTETNSNASVTFIQKDIIAIEVTAAGYQKYNGNLIIDDLNNQKQAFDIGLNKIPTFLAVVVPNIKEGQKLVVKNENGSIINLKILDNRHWFSSIEAKKNYKISLTDTKTNSVLYSSDFSATDGLHLVNIEVKEKIEPIKVPEVKAEILPTEPVAMLPQDQRVIYFDQSDCIIKPELTARLDAVVMWLKQNPTTKIRLVGHTDDVGDPKLNEALSELRAKAVYNYFFYRGIPENRLIYAGYGGKYPVKPNDVEANKSMNRRVEIGYVNK